MNRQIPTSDQALATMIREMRDDIDKLNRGAQFSGRVSFGSGIQLGNVLITTPTMHTVKFTNVTNGKTATLTLT